MSGWKELANVFLKRLGIRQFGPLGYSNHMRVADLIEAVGRERFDEFFSFAFVRNPWDWEVSHYNYILRSKTHPSHELVASLKSFEQYVRWRCDGNFQTQADLLTVGGEVVIDFIGRFETLATDFRQICRRLRIRSRLPRLNTTRRRPYHSYYSDATAELIRQAFIDDVRLFGYGFESTPKAA